MKTISFLFLFLIGTAAPAQAFQGTRGGGDLVAYEFTLASKRLVRLFSENESLRALFPEVDLGSLATAVEKTRVESKDALTLDGRQVDAINYPAEGRIEVSRKRWADFPASSRRMSIALHEFLGILKLNDENYIVSYRFDRWFQANGQGEFTCRLEKQGERYRTDEGIELKKFIGEQYVLKVDGVRAGTVSYNRPEETLAVATYARDGRDVLSNSWSHLEPGAEVDVHFITDKRRYVLVHCGGE